MMLKQEKYQAFSAIQMSFRVSPMCAAFYVLLSLAYALVGTLGIALTTAHFVDTAVDILQNARPRGDVVFPLILLLVVLGVDTTARAVVQLFAARIELNLQRKFKPAIVEKHAALDFKHIENAGSWELIARISRDPVKAVMDGFDGFVTLMRIIISVVSVGLLIMTHIWWAAVVIFVFSIPMFWLSVWAGKKNYQATRDTEQYYRRVDYLDEVLTGRDAVDERTLFGYGETVGEQWLEQYEIRRKKLLRIHARMYYINKGSGVFLGLIVVFVAMTLIQPVIAGTVTAGLFMGIIGAVFSLLNGIGWMMTGALEQISGVGEYMKDLTAFAHLSEASGALNKPDKSPLDLETLEFRNVRFRYPGSDKTILDGLTFSLERGRHYAFVGKNGAGKTTLTKLLTGLYTEYEGEILINGKELREYEQSALKALFSVVYQDFARYYISMKDNVLLGDVSGEQDDTRVMDAIQQAGLADTVTGLKDGADSPLGKIKEGGQDLSGGQWQRVAIARSLMSRASVKILDEPTAALDPISESRIYEEFEHLMSGKTTIFISHRLGSTKLADDIIVIDGGQVAERGVHDQLMAKGGIYAEMYESQRRWYV